MNNRYNRVKLRNKLHNFKIFFERSPITRTLRGVKNPKAFVINIGLPWKRRFAITWTTEDRNRKRELDRRQRSLETTAVCNSGMVNSDSMAVDTTGFIVAMVVIVIAVMVVTVVTIVNGLCCFSYFCYV